MSKETKEIFEFGGFKLDVQEHVLERSDGVKVDALPEKAFQTLVHLLRNSGTLVEKEELLAVVWPDATVEENNLDKAIHTIRHVLGETKGESKYIETVRKHGYRFVAPVTKTGSLHVQRFESLVPATGPTVQLAKPKITASGQHVMFDLLNPPVTDVFTPKVAPDAINSANIESPPAADSPTSSIRWVLIAASGAILLAAAVGAAFLWRSEPQFGSAEFTFRRITAAGGTARAVVSPDGQHAAVVINNALVLFGLDNGSERLLVPAVPGIGILKIAFSPDGSVVYYGTKPADKTLITIYSLPIGGGEPRKVLDDIYSSLSFSSDGRKIAFVRRYPELNEYAILTANADGSNLINLASSRLPNRFEGTPVWSPDGTEIVCSAISVEGGFHFTVARINVRTGSVDLVPDQRWTGINSIVWLPASDDLILAAQDRDAITAQIWSVDMKTGTRNRLVTDPYVYESITGSSDGTRFVALRVRQSSQVWILGDAAVQLTAGFDNADGVSGLSWLNDGGVLFHSRAGGRDAIWRMRSDGSGASMITPDTTGGFAVSPDNRFLVFQGKQSADHLGLQIRDLVRETERSLTENVTAMAPSFFPDGKRVAFSVYDKKTALYEVSIDGRSPVLLNDEFRAAMTPSVSPSGKSIAFGINRVEAGKLQTGIAIFDYETKRVVSTFSVKTNSTTYEEPTIQWSADESAVYFILLENSVSNIMKINIADGAVSNVTSFAEGRIFNFAVEPGTNRILAARGQLEKEATLLQLKQPF